MSNRDPSYQNAANAFRPNDLCISNLSDNRTNTGSIDQVVGAAKAITGATAADPIVITSTAHGRADGDFVSQIGSENTESNGAFVVGNKADNTYELFHMDGVTGVDGLGETPGTTGTAQPAFGFQPEINTVLLATQFGVTVADETTSAAGYLGLPALTNGIDVEIWNNTGLIRKLNPLPIKKFADWESMLDIVINADQFGGADKAFEVHGSLVPTGFGGSLLLTSATFETLIVRVNDALTGLIYQQGHLNGIIERI